MIFYFGNQFGQASAKLLAFGILHMRGVAGRSGWFWLFVLMGAFTCFSGFIFGFLLPDSFRNPCSTFLPGRAIFTPREVHILRSRVLLDDPAKGKKKKRIGLAAFKKAFSNWRMWVHLLITFANNTPQRGFDTYAPSIVKDFGFAGLTANALAAVGLFLQIPVSYTFSYVSDRYSRRGETVMAGLSMHLLGYIFNRVFTEINSRGVRYFGVVWTQTFGTFSHPLNITWMSLTCTDSEERALAMAMVIMGANLSGVAGGQLYRADDRPRYRRAFNVSIGILVAGLALAVVRFLDDKLGRKKVKTEAPESDTGSETYGDGVLKAAVPADEQPQPIALHGRRASLSKADI
jgi:predicted MFS family arabinose efflux permease